MTTTFTTIPLSDINDLAREIAIAWCDETKVSWIGDRAKLASDIMNYAIAKLPTDEQVANWFKENIDGDSASSAIYKFRLWLNEIYGKK